MQMSRDDGTEMVQCELRERHGEGVTCSRNIRHGRDRDPRERTSCAHRTTLRNFRIRVSPSSLSLVSIYLIAIITSQYHVSANRIYGPLPPPVDPIPFNSIMQQSAATPHHSSQLLFEPKWTTQFNPHSPQYQRGHSSNYDAAANLDPDPDLSSMNPNLILGFATSMPDMILSAVDNSSSSLPPSSPLARVAPAMVDEALEWAHRSAEQIRRLENDLTSAGSIVNMSRISTVGRHAVQPYDPQRVKLIHDEQQLFEQATKMLAANFSIPPDQIRRMDRLVSESKLARKARQVCALDMEPVTCFQSRYRTADGSCNNMHHPLWGKSNTCLGRLLESEYADGIAAPRISQTGAPLPNPRFISTTIHSHRDRRDSFTQLLMQWGQFLDHDMSFTPLLQMGGGQAIQCCPFPSHPECFPIAIPRDDPFYAPLGQTCMNFVRSTTCGSCSFGPRQQLTQITAFLDASQVYGNMLNQTMSLRTLDGTGRLKFSLSLVGTPLLPLSQNGNDQCSQREESLICFRSGDIRVNQQPGLTSLQTIFMRQHNRIARILSKINPHWQEEVIFQETRRILGAQMQVIAYKEYLPLVLGEDAMRYYKLHLQEHGYTDYDPEIEPTILTEFSTAAYRFGHSQVQGMMSRITASGLSTTVNLRDVFFFPFDLFEGKLDAILRGLIGRSAQKTDPFIHGDVRNHLYKPRGDMFGTDLAAFNINRGRDHGIPGYSKYLSYCFDEHVDSFEELDHYMPASQRMKLQKIYKRVEDIDLWTGGLSEYPLEGALVGPTFSCIIGIQFHHLKFGDRFWFEHGHQPGSFTPGQLQSLRHTLLAKVLCENGDHFRFIHKQVFLRESAHDPIVPCEELPDLDFSKWKDHAYSG